MRLIGIRLEAVFGLLLVGILVGSVLLAITPSSPYQFLLLSLTTVVFLIPFKRLRHIPLSNYALIGGIVGHLFFGNLDIGPFSIRIYAMGILSLVIITNVLLLRKKLFRTALARDLAMIYTLFVIWTFLTRIAHGDEISAVVLGVSATHLFALAGFVVVQYVVVTSRQIVFFAIALAFTAVLSAAFAVAQWFGIEQAWDTTLFLRRGVEGVVLGTDFGTSGFVPGLALFSIGLSYHLLGLGFLVYTWTTHNSKTKSQYTIFGVAITSVVFLALLFSQSRSAVWAVFAIIGVSLWLPRLARGRKFGIHRVSAGGYVVIIGLTGIILVTVITQLGRFYPPTVEAGAGGYRLEKVFNLADPKRARVAIGALEIALENPIVGTSSSEYFDFISERLDEGDRVITPHNLFLNAITFTGIPGLVILAVLLYGLLRLIRATLRAIRIDTSLNWVGMGAILGLLAHFFNSQFHNAGFATGDPMPWWLIGLMVSIVAHVKENPPGPDPHAEV